MKHFKKHSMSKQLLAVLLGSAASVITAILPASASAASTAFTTEFVGEVEVTLSAAAGVENSVTVQTQNGVVFYDDNDTIIAGAGCIQDAPNQVTCGRGRQVRTANVLVGDRDDTVFVNDEDLPTYSNRILGEAGDDVLYGGIAPDILNGGPGDDYAHGGAHFDQISGGPGNDFLEGGTNGDDFFSGEGGNDVIIGSNGPDRVLYRASEGAVFTSLQDGYAQYGKSIDYIENVEDVSGSDFDDWLIGDDRRNDIHGGNGGDDLLSGLGGDDRMDGSNGSDAIYGDSGNDVQHGGSGSDELDGDSGFDVLFGEEGDDTLTGGPDSDGLHGERGDDTVYSRDGVRDEVDCGADLDFVTADLLDVVALDCEEVDRA